jgi:hypothetical protein
MPPSVRIARACWSLIVGVSLCLASCSSSTGRRDINYGTDVAVGFVPPDSAPTPALDAAAEAAASPDGGAAVDVSVDQGN